MRLLGLDVGSSSVKAAVLRGDGPPRGVVRVEFSTDYSDDGVSPRAEVKLVVIERAIRSAIRSLGALVKNVDLIAAATMAPSWLANDEQGRAITNVVTHQDRRSTAEAAEIERRVGKARHLQLAGNRPFPGGISSTTFAWQLKHNRAAMKRARVIGHLGTWLTFALTGANVIDLSNAGFTGLMNIKRLEWDDVLCKAGGIAETFLPRIVESDGVVGNVTPAAARRFGLRVGTPVLAGCVDGSAAMLAAGARVGQVVNVAGSTDVLAVCTREPHPHEQLLTRPLGVDGKWLSVGTIAAAGSALEWVRQTCFRDMPAAKFFRHVGQIAKRGPDASVKFDATLAGSRTAMTALAGRLDRLTLSTTRDDILAALLADLARAKALRLERFADAGVRLSRDVMLTGGGAARGTSAASHHRTMNEATLRGLWALGQRS